MENINKPWNWSLKKEITTKLDQTDRKTIKACREYNKNQEPNENNPEWYDDFLKLMNSQTDSFTFYLEEREQSEKNKEQQQEQTQAMEVKKAEHYKEQKALEVTAAMEKEDALQKLHQKLNNTDNQVASWKEVAVENIENKEEENTITLTEKQKKTIWNFLCGGQKWQAQRVSTNGLTKTTPKDLKSKIEAFFGNSTIENLNTLVEEIHKNSIPKQWTLVGDTGDLDQKVWIIWDLVKKFSNNQSTSDSTTKKHLESIKKMKDGLLNLSETIKRSQKSSKDFLSR